MDWPVLRHLDILIGLSVVMLIVSTAVVGINQAIVSMTRMRAKQLSQMLGELIGAILPEVAGEGSSYLAERLLRHPRIGRAKTMDLAQWFPWKKDYYLPALERGEAILRHEVIGLLLEWCAEEGGFRSQEWALAGKPEGVRRWILGEDSAETAIQKEKVDLLRAQVKAGLARLGVSDPAATAAAVRKSFAEKQAANPSAEAHTLYTQAIVEVGLGDFGAKVFAWYDNTMERTSEFFTVRAKALTIVVSLGVALLIQLDSIDLLRRLSGDDKLRAALVAKSATAQKAYEAAVGEAQQSQKDAAAAATTDQEAKKKGDAAAGEEAKKQAAAAASKEAGAKEALEAAKKELDGVVAELRDPKATVLDNPLLFEKVAVMAFEPQMRKSEERWWLVVDGAAQKDLVLSAGTPTAQQWAAAIVGSKAPVDAYVGKAGLVEVVARNATIGKLALWKSDAKPAREIAAGHGRAVDWGGHGKRLPGVLLTALLLSLGAPFWYDQLKNLMKLRSLVLNQDEKERTDRQTAQTASSGASGGATTPPANPPQPGPGPGNGGVGAAETAKVVVERTPLRVAIQPVEEQVVLTTDASLRKEPVAGSPVTRSLEKGTPVIVLGKSSPNDNGKSDWYEAVEGDFLRGEDTEG